MSTLSLDYPATITHINARKEGPEADKVVAVDVKFELNCDAFDLAYFDSQLRSFLFDDADGGGIRFPMMEPVRWKGEIKHMNIDLCGLTFAGVMLKKFEFQPFISDKSVQQVRMTFQASFQPEGRAIAVLAEYLQEMVPLRVESQPQLDL